MSGRDHYRSFLVYVREVLTKLNDKSGQALASLLCLLIPLLVGDWNMQGSTQ